MDAERSVGGWVVAAALVVVAALFWYFRIFVPASEYSFLTGADLFLQIYPMSHAAAQSILRGVVPLWNPFQYAGHPFLATALYGVLYPPNAAYLVLPTALAIEAVIVTHLSAAGLFSFWYARAIGLGRGPAAAAGVGFMLSGYVASQAVWFTPSLAASAWLPLALLAIEKICATRRWRWTVLLAAAMAMSFLAGWTQTWLYSMYAIGVYGGARVIALGLRRQRRAECVRVAAMLAVALPLWAALVAAQLLPTAELQSLGPRRPGGLQVRQTMPLGPSSPAALVAGATRSELGLPSNMYLGMVGLVLIPLSLFARGMTGRVVVLWALALGSIVVALSVYTPLFSLYRMTPGAAWFRLPQRILFLYALAGSVLCAMGVEVVGRMAATPVRVWHLVAAALGTLIGIVWLAAVELPAPSRAYLALALGLLWAAVLLRSGWGRSAVVAGLVGLLAWDLFAASSNRNIHPLHARRRFDAEREVFDFIKREQGLYRTYIHDPWSFGGPALMEKQGTLREIFSITDYEPLSLSRYGKFFRLVAPRRGGDPDLLPFVGRMEVDPWAPNFRLLDLMSLRYIVVHQFAGAFHDGLTAAGWRLVFRPAAGQQLVYENPRPRPRAYVVHRIVSAADEEAALRALTGASFDAREAAILEPGESGDLPEPEPGKTTTAVIASYRATRVVVQTDDPKAGYLVLTDTYYPGWKVYLDGERAPMSRANYLFRAVAVPAGRHTVAFVYDPLSFKLGAALSLAALCCTAFVWGLALVRRRLRART